MNLFADSCDAMWRVLEHSSVAAALCGTDGSFSDACRTSCSCAEHTGGCGVVAPHACCSMPCWRTPTHALTYSFMPQTLQHTVFA